MSGILALLRTDGAPVEPQLAQRLTASMTLRGPDAQETWCGGRIALGHTLLRTTYEAAGEHQPLSLDGHVWIVADGRVDARRDLARAIGGETESTLLKAPDVELLLRAYLKWGDACVDHLLGDFAFAIWDGPRQRLFCARDHMGVKPFYYASVGQWLLVSSTIDALRRHPAVSDRLNDLAIADFLMFGFNQEHATTSFHDIQRLPPAHTLTWSAEGPAIRRYWTLPIEEPVYYRKDDEYVDEFRALVREAVDDRLRTQSVSVFMSGGLDSSMLAATAQEVLRGGVNADPVQAFTFVYDSLIPDQERKYASMVAEHLGIPIRYYVQDERLGWHPPRVEFPEPYLPPADSEPESRCYGDMAAHSRVALYGEGPDNALLYEWRTHLKWLLRQKRWGRLLLDVGKHLAAHRRIPLVPTIPRMLRERQEREALEPACPACLSPDLVKRLSLNERWRLQNAMPGSAHPNRPRGHASLLTAQWQSLFETYEPAYTQNALEVRHPYVDTRVLRFMLSVPAFPWCRAKYLLRRAMVGMVPEHIRQRPKQGLAADPFLEQSRRVGLPSVRLNEAVAAYGSSESIPGSSPSAVYAILRFGELSRWTVQFESPRAL